MRARVLTVALALCAAATGCSDGDDPTTPSQPGGTTLWGRRFGKSTGTDPVALAVGGAGEVVVGGRFFATTDFGSGPVTSPANNWQAFVAKYDGEGAPVWSKSLGDIFEEQVTTVALDGAGNVYVAGTFRGTIDLGNGPLESEQLGVDLFVAKLAPDGSPLWSKHIGTDSFDQLDGMEVDAQGGVALVGHVGNGADFGTGPMTFNGAPFVAKLEPSGTVAYITALEFALEFGGYPSAFGVDSAGAIVVAATYYDEYEGQGLYVSKLGPAGQPAWAHDFPGVGDNVSVTDLSVADDDSIFLSGSLGLVINLGGGVMSSVSQDSYYGDVFAAALAPDGAPRWVRRFAPQRGRVDEFDNPLPGWLVANAIAAVDGGLVLTGSFLGETDLGGGARQSAGYAELENAYSDDVFALRLDADGSYLWDTTFGNTNQQAATSVDADPTGDVFLAGWANGGLSFGDGGYADTGYYDGFVVKLAR